jgi:hypothetical protein
MTPDEYLASILQRETVQHGLLSPLWAVQTESNAESPSIQMIDPD